MSKCDDCVDEIVPKSRELKEFCNQVLEKHDLAMKVIQSPPKPLPNPSPKSIPNPSPKPLQAPSPKPLQAPSAKQTRKKKSPKNKTKKQSDLKTSPQPSTVAEMTTEYIAKTTTHIQQFKTAGISAIESLSQKELAAIIVLASDKYYNTINEILLTDTEYDIVKEYMQTKFPKDITNQQIGAPITGKNKVNLPYEMWSMDKIKPDSGALLNWVNKYKGPYILSCKLDGVSGLYSTEGETPKLYTRGDGKIGQDISHLLKILKLPTTKGIVVRGEFLISKATFESKYASQFANPRNLVSGIINAKAVAGKADRVDNKAADLDFVTYEVVIPKLKPGDQLQKLTELGFKVVEHKTETALTNELLSDYLVDMRKNHPYEIDGIIVTDDAIHPRVSGNPDHAFAFKMMLSDQKAEAKVVDVEWSPSKDGFLKPRVRIEPIKLGGVTITYATGYNAKFIEDNKLGVGAIVELIRSGDVIPKILSTTVPAEKPQMPLVPYIWNETHVDILLENASEDRTVQEKNVTAFFSELDVDGLKAGNVRKIMDAGFDTVAKILKMTEADFKTAGFKTMAPKYVENIASKVGEASLLKIMVASGKLGRGLGERKLGPIMETHPDILVSEETPAQKIAKVKTVAGIEQKSAQLFVENIPVFLAFLKECDLENKLTAKAAPKSAKVFDQSNPLYDKEVVMTKVRDQDIISALEAAGGKLANSISAGTLVLIVKSKADESKKKTDALKKGVPIMTPEEFKEKYM
jgi:NAD-dependent DNA ligase